MSNANIYSENDLELFFLADFECMANEFGKKNTGATANDQVIFRTTIQDKGQFHV